MVRASERPTPNAVLGAPRAPRPLAVRKLEAAGNDFLVVLQGKGVDAAGGPSASLSADDVRRLCTRRRGVGADGLIVGRALPDDADLDLEMLLWNADGSAAEMSGNGIRCLALAARERGLLGSDVVRVATAAGRRTVSFADGGTSASVDMGPVRLGDEVTSPLPGTRARLAGVGNPHLVVIGGAQLELSGLDLPALAEAASDLCGAPVNVEVVVPGVRAGADLELRVHERGVGETAACGTGTCAAAAVARAYGLVGRDVTVDNPGGRLTVHLGDAPGDAVQLGGPVRGVADVVVDLAALQRSAGGSADSADSAEVG